MPSSLKCFATVLEPMAKVSITAAELGAVLPADQRPRAGAGMVCMMKLGLITIAPAEEAKPD